MSIEQMPTIGGVDRFEAENALDILIRASAIESSPKLMGAVKEVAQQKAIEAAKIANELSAQMPLTTRHPDRDREGKVDF